MLNEDDTPLTNSFMKQKSNTIYSTNKAAVKNNDII